MYCKNCGKEIGDDAKFCPGCGKSVDHVEPKHDVKTSSSKKGRKKSALKKWWFWALAILVLMAIIPAIKNSGDSGSKTITTTTVALQCDALSVIKDASNEQINDIYRKLTTIDIKSILSASYDETLKNTFSNTGEEGYRISTQGYVNILVFVKDGELVAVTHNDNIFYSDGKPLHSIKDSIALQRFCDPCPISMAASVGEDSIGTAEIQASITNKSEKDIAAIKFLCIPYDVYGKNIKYYGSGETYITLTYDDGIDKGKQKDLQWALYGQSNTKSADLYIFSVYFTDGTEWGMKDEISFQQVITYGTYLKAE